MKSRQRAAQVAAPGAQRIVFTGIMAVPDDFGRLRVLLAENSADGTPDGSWAALARGLPRASDGYSVPYELWADGPDADGIRGVVRVAVPARHRAHWGQVAESLRGQEVQVEATARPFAFRLDTESAPETAQAVAAGVALDLAMLGPRPRREAL